MNEDAFRCFLIWMCIDFCASSALHPYLFLCIFKFSFLCGPHVRISAISIFSANMVSIYAFVLCMYIYIPVHGYHIQGYISRSRKDGALFSALEIRTALTVNPRHRSSFNLKVSHHVGRARTIPRATKVERVHLAEAIVK